MDWVSVKDLKRHPPNDQDVLVVLAPTEEEKLDGSWTEPWITIASWSDEAKCFIHLDDPYVGQRATHWMPLPELPQGAGTEKGETTDTEKRWIPIVEEKPPLNEEVWFYWHRGLADGTVLEGARIMYHEHEIYKSVFAGSLPPTHWCRREKLPEPPSD